MDVKKINAPASTVTRDLDKLDKETGNIYESVRIIAKRSNKISVDLKQELNRKLEEFAYYT
ncbi:MAG TPA: DNA-directed RNA polymerase subunit omega, partial [Tenuifilaceae bacterium]|nr:DNA-directed RNA polymerase subunit omega [Tenuifilaceae bacterium]